MPMMTLVLHSNLRIVRMDSIDFKEFIKKVKNVSGNRKHKICNSFGFNFFFGYYRKNKPLDKEFVLNGSTYSSIINEMNIGVADKLLENKSIKLPCSLGVLSVVKNQTDTWIDSDGNLKTTKKVDMASTLKLWYEDEDAMRNKTLVRFDNEYTFKIMLDKRRSKVKNKMYFHFAPNRDLKIKLKNNINNSNYDAYEQVKMGKFKGSSR